MDHDKKRVTFRALGLGAAVAGRCLLQPAAASANSGDAATAPTII
jgi:hypothetical protein